MPIHIPTLPAALMAILGVLATLITAVAPSLPSPWHEVAVAVLAVLTFLGVGAAHAAVRAAVREAHDAGVAAGRGGK